MKCGKKSRRGAKYRGRTVMSDLARELCQMEAGEVITITREFNTIRIERRSKAHLTAAISNHISVLQMESAIYDILVHTIRNQKWELAQIRSEVKDDVDPQ